MSYTDEQRKLIHNMVMELSDEVFTWFLEKEPSPVPRIAYFALCACIARLGIQCDITPDVALKYIEEIAESSKRNIKKKSFN